MAGRDEIHAGASEVSGVALIERGQELEFLGDLLRQAIAGAGKVALVTGVVAVGKTELVVNFARSAAARGVRVLHIGGSEFERGTPYGLIAQWADPPRAPRDAPDRQNRRAIGDQLLALSRESPLLVVVDDVHLADGDSLRDLMHVIRRIRAARVMLLFTEAERPPQANAVFHAEILRSPHCHRVRLAALSPNGVRAVLAEHLGEDTAGRLAPGCHAVSGGNPLLVRALLQDHGTAARDATADAREIPAGTAFARTVLTCLGHSGPVALEVARGIALLGPHASAELLGRLLGRDPADLKPLLRTLTRAGLLDMARFRHPAARAAVLQDPGFHDRRAQHYRVAELLDAEGRPVTAVAGHLVAADRAGHPWAVPALREAAADALNRDDTDFAVTCLELAHREARHDADRAALAAKLIHARWRVNPARATPHFADLLALWHAGRLPHREARTLIHALLWHGRADEAWDILTGLSGRGGDAAVTARLIAAQPWLRSAFPARAGRITGRTPDRSAPPPENIARRAEETLRNHRVEDWWLLPAVTAVLDLIHTDHLNRAEWWCQHLRGQAETRGLRVWLGVTAALQAEILRRHDRLAAAAERAATALGHLSGRAWGVLIGLPLGVLASVATARGALQEAAAHLERPVPEAMFHTRFGLPYQEARGAHHLAMGRHQEALRDFLMCGHRLREWRMDTPALVDWRTGAADALVRLGDTEQARRLLSEQALHPGARHPRIRGAALRVLAGTAAPQRRLAPLREAAGLLDGGHSPFELLRTLAELSRAHQLLGEQSQSRSVIRRAWRVARECGAEELADRLLHTGLLVPDRPPATGPGHGGGSPLSGAELRVAELAALGHTNREIADRLFVTVSTVEQHLTRIYRKLKVARRADLSGRPDLVRSDVA
jgi:DNA-binding CsgD family transcriptional regulator